jgi:hypothetical protein
MECINITGNKVVIVYLFFVGFLDGFFLDGFFLGIDLLIRVFISFIISDSDFSLFALFYFSSSLLTKSLILLVICLRYKLLLYVGIKSNPSLVKRISFSLL